MEIIREGEIRGKLVPTMENMENFESSLERKWACQKSYARPRYARPRSLRDHPLLRGMLIIFIGKLGVMRTFNEAM